MPILQSIRENRHKLKVKRAKNKGAQKLDKEFNDFEAVLSSYEDKKYEITSEVIERLLSVLNGLRVDIQKNAIMTYCNSISYLVALGRITKEQYIQKKPLVNKWQSRTKSGEIFTQNCFEEFKDDLAQFDQDYHSFWKNHTSQSKFEQDIWQDFFVEYENRLTQFAQRIVALRRFFEKDEPYFEKISESAELNDIEQMIDTHFSQISPREFENLIGELFKKMGYHVTVTPLTGDFGIDVIATIGEEVIAIQAKKHRIGNNIGNRDVQRLLGAMQQRNVRANKAVLITSSDFTLQAIEQAKETPVELWNKNYLAKMLREYM